MIDIRHLSQAFTSPDGKTVHAVKDVSLHINKGEIFGIIGRSGAGKSTLVRTINYLNKPTEGTVKVNGQCLNELSTDELRTIRSKIGMIFQHFNLLSSRTVFDNIALPLELHNVPREEINQKVSRLIDLVGLTEHKDKYPKQLSGGQKQRVGIARALANDPIVLLSDEATSALDPETTRSTLDLLLKINQTLGVTIVLITHEMEVVKQICDRVVVMDKGEIVEIGAQPARNRIDERQPRIMFRGQFTVVETRGKIAVLTARRLFKGERSVGRVKLRTDPAQDRVAGNHIPADAGGLRTTPQPPPFEFRGNPPAGTVVLIV